MISKSEGPPIDDAPDPLWMRIVLIALILLVIATGCAIGSGIEFLLNRIEQPAREAQARQRVRAEQVCQANGLRYGDIVYAGIETAGLWMNTDPQVKYPTARCVDKSGVIHNFDFLP